MLRTAKKRHSNFKRMVNNTKIDIEGTKNAFAVFFSVRFFFLRWRVLIINGSGWQHMSAFISIRQSFPKSNGLIVECNA